MKDAGTGREYIVVRASIREIITEKTNRCIKSIMSIIDSNTNVPCSECSKKPDKCYHSRMRKSVLDECNDLSREFEEVLRAVIENIDEEVSA